MKQVLSTLVVLSLALSLAACSGQPARPSKGGNTVISSAHNVQIEGGVLKILSDDERNVLYLYVRPEKIDHWVVAGGGGGKQTEPWLFKSSIVWAQGDEHGWHSNDAPKMTFNFELDSRDMKLTTDKGTYAVRGGDLVVISLDEDWYPGNVNSGVDALRQFDLPQEETQRLVSKVRQHYTGP